MIPTYIYFVLRHYVSAHKLPMPPVVITCIGVVVNIILNAVFKWVSWLASIGVCRHGLAIIADLYLDGCDAGRVCPYQSLSVSRPFARMFRFDFSIMKQLLVVVCPLA